MKKLKILAIVTMMILVLFVAAVAAFAYFGVLSFNIGEEGGIGSLGEIILNPQENKKTESLRWQTEETIGDTLAQIKTSEGDITIKLAKNAAGEKFAELKNSGAFDGSEFSVLAENMFIQASASGENFSAEKNDLGCFYGSVGFVLDKTEASPSFFIITAKELSGLSKAYISEENFDEERAPFYEKFGGIPEYEGKVLVFGQVISGMETVHKIAEKENFGYTGGYFAAEPVKIESVEILYTEVITD